MPIGNINSSFAAASSSSSSFAQKMRNVSGQNGTKSIAEQSGLVAPGTDALGTGVEVQDILLRRVSTKELRERAEDAVDAAQTEFVDRFIKEFDPEGEWLAQSMPQDKLQEFAVRLDEELKSNNWDGARKRMRDFLGELAEIAGRKIRQIGSRSSSTLRKSFTEGFGDLAYADGAPSRGQGEALGKTVDSVPGAGEKSVNQRDSLGEYTTITTDDGQKISGYKNDDGMTVMDRRDPTRIPDGEEPGMADDLIGGLVEEIHDLYTNRLDAMYGKEAGAPGLQNAIEAVMGKMDSLFRNAYQNNYSEDAESVMQKGAEMFAGALFGQIGMQNLVDREADAAAQAGLRAKMMSNGSMSEEKKLYSEVYAELTKDLPNLGNLYSRAAGSGVGVTDEVFAGLDNIFMDRLLERLDGRKLAQVITVTLKGRHYTNEELELLKQQGNTMDKTV